MKWPGKISILILCYLYIVQSASIPKKLASDETLRCLYFGGNDNIEYECLLTISNPNGIEFDQVEGDHLAGFGNEDVRIVATVGYGSSPIVPSVICRQFPNMYLLSILGIDVEEITPEAFAACRNLREVYIVFNQITTVPANTFANSPLLEYIELSRNSITELNENSFTGTALLFVAIDYNELSSFDQNWFTSVNGTLRHLELMRNEITVLGDNAFSNLRGITELNFNYNPLGNGISGSAFSGLEVLDSLSLSGASLPSLNPEWFESIPQLRSFTASNNQLTELADGTFTALHNLRELYLIGNRIREISLPAFGQATRQLRTFYISDNRINNIDPYWFAETENLEFFLLAGNLCIDEDFMNVGMIRWRMFEALQQCTDNFMLDPWVMCQYQEQGEYMCLLQIHNPNGRNDFQEVTGDHLEGRGNEDVIFASALGGNTMIVPSIICETFVNLRSILLAQSNIEVLHEDHFRNCNSLTDLILSSNFITTVPDFVFRGAPNLFWVDLSSNQIETLGENAFSGTNINSIILGMNRFTSFDQRWFESVNSTLSVLDLFRNDIISLSNDAFSNLATLRTLILGENTLWDLPPTAFDSLVNLNTLDLHGCSLGMLNPAWFRNLRQLNNLNLMANSLGVLPDGIFDSLPNLRSITLHTNNLRVLSADSFGTSLNSLVNLDATSNRIRAFDERILEEASNLDWLSLQGNICIDRGFTRVSEDLENVLQLLSYCNTNFGPERVECRYYQPGEDYTCSLSIFNPLGRDEFSSIDGEHISGRGDGDVRAMYINEGRTLNVPSILCDTFENLESMDFLHDEIEYLDHRSFRNCRNLRRLYVYDNKIESLPSGLFNNNPLLEEVHFGHNRLRAMGIPTDIFAGTSLTFLDLSDNPIVDFNPAWIIPVASTLKTLDLDYIEATHLPVLFFNNPSVLEHLEISGNPFREIVPQVFDRLPTLRSLDMADCNFRSIDPNWFRELSQLEFLRLSNNQILDIPENAFARLQSLKDLSIYNNKLRELNSNAFGSSLQSIETIYAQNNEIVGVDSAVLDATNLSTLYLSGNRCSRENFYDVNENRDEVRESLSSCIENLNSERISCEYGLDFEDQYTCSMSIFNPIGRNNFARIEGDHLSGNGDSDVHTVTIWGQDTRLIPSIICQQFPGLKTLIIFASKLDLFTERNLRDCNELQGLMIYENDLFELPNFAFQGNSALVFLELGFNKITRIGDFAFSGAPIQFLDLASNDLGRFNPRVFETINSTLESLDLMNTNIRGIPPNAFANLRNLKTLVLNRNPLEFNLPRNAFDGLDQLEDLFMTSCELWDLDTSWFRTLGSLRTLFLNNNEISLLRPGVFNSLRSLTFINLENNFIWELNPAQFGNSLNTLETINFENNIINIMHEPFITESSSLNSLWLEGNVCVNENFANVNQNTNEAIAALRRCIENANVTPTISCAYEHITPDDYSCTLSVTDPRGFHIFQGIPGDHLAGRTNNDVRLIMAHRQDTRTFPSVICNQFPQLEDITFIRSNLESLGVMTFSTCRNLRVLMLDGGFIRILPPRVFGSIPNLEYLSLADNLINVISPLTFAGAPIRTLDLAFNRLSLILPEVMDPLNETLTVLDMNGNLIRGFPPAAFENLRNIEVLHLDRNPLTELETVTFLTLPNLQVLTMSHCQLTSLNPMMFFEMVNVHTLRLNDNEIEVLPDGAFHNMSSLEDLHIGNNRIGQLTAAQLGGALSSIIVIGAANNRINAVDRELLENSPNLSNLLLDGNVCVDGSFSDVQGNIDDVMEALNICFDNFDTEAIIECTYDMNEEDEYGCEARIHNPVDEDFQSIAGQHIADMADEHVHIVSIVNQNTKTFPSVLCNQFSDLRFIFISDSNLDFVEAPAFANCRNLQFIYITQNRITSLPARLFANSPNLEHVVFASNRINQIHPDAFVGTSISFLDLGFNEISNLNQAWFQPIRRTLQTLDLNGNNIRRLQNQTFGDLPELLTLAFDGNHFEADSDPFGGLGSLRTISLSRCGLRELNPRWFTSIPLVTEIILDGNGITELPSRTFESLRNLESFRLEDNLLTSFSPAAFGSAIGNLENIDLTHNVVTSIDPTLLDNATNLNRLHLQGNICINRNFMDVLEQADEVREALQDCFDNFN